MSLLVPVALLGLLTLPAIILLHLLRNRRELLPISSLRLWRGLEQKRQGALPRTIPLSLMLVLQLLIATALTFALAQPVFSFLQDRPEHHIFILDTTTSMLTEDARPAGVTEFVSESTGLGTLHRRFDVARSAVQEALDALDDQDSFAIVNLNRQPEILLSGDGNQKAQAQLALENLVPGGTGLDLPAAITLANGLIAADRANRLTVLSDGNYAVNPDRLPPALAPLEWRSLGAGPSASQLPNFANQALLNVSSRPLPDGRRRVFARLVNYGDTLVARTLRLSTDGNPLDEQAVTLGAFAESEQVWTLPATVETALVEIVEPDVLPLDNRAELFLAGTTRYQVLLLTDRAADGENYALHRALEAQAGVELIVETGDTLDPTRASSFDLVVFDGLPPTLTAWPSGNVLVVNPALGHPLLMAQNFARNLRPDLTSGSPLLAGVDLSGVYFNRLPQLIVPEWAEVDLIARAVVNNDEQFPLILHGSTGSTDLVVWTFDLAESNLPARLALPLLTGNALSSLLSNAVPPVIALGEPLDLGRSMSVEMPGGRRLPATAIVGGQFFRTKQPGIYRLFNRSERQVGGFAIHAGSTLESNLTTHFDPATLGSVDTGAGQAPPETRFDEYWPWLVAAALALIVGEGWLAWRT